MQEGMPTSRLRIPHCLSESYTLQRNQNQYSPRYPMRCRHTLTLAHNSHLVNNSI